MKKLRQLIRSYTSFTRTERMGVAALCLLLLILVMVRAALHYIVHPPTEPAEEQKVREAWNAFKRSEPRDDNDSATETQDFVDASDQGDTPIPDQIDINSADSATLVRLRGIGPASARKIVAWRTANGPFKSVDELAENHLVTRSAYAILKNHFYVGGNKNGN